MREILEPLYAEISIDIADESLDAREKGAQLAVRGLTPGRALGLALLAHTSPAHRDTLEWLGARMESGGEAINRSHSQEIGILATAVLLKAWKGEPSLAATTGALVVGCGSFLGWKPRVARLGTAGDAYLDRASLTVRGVGEVELDRVNLASSAEEAFPDEGGYSPEALRGLHKEVADLREELDEALVALSDAQRAVAEQSSILWWLFGQRLTDGRPWAEAKEAARPLELARDLHELTAFVPGPRGATNFLAEAMTRSQMNTDRELTIGGAVRVIGSDSKLHTVSSPPSSALLALPVLGCLYRAEYPGKARPGGLHRSALEIAGQLYRELLIQEAIQEGADE